MDPITLRTMERLLAVLIGGMTIYLGYRLFLALPERREGEGKFELPGGISIFISRVGPGVFFSLFGVAVVGLSIQSSIEYSRGSIAASDARPAVSANWEGYIGLTPDSMDLSSGSAESRRIRMRRELTFMNELPDLMRPDLNEAEESRATAHVERVKLGLMASVWDPRWPSFSEFEDWWDEGAFDPPPAGLEEAVALYRSSAGSE